MTVFPAIKLSGCFRKKDWQLNKDAKVKRKESDHYLFPA